MPVSRSPHLIGSTGHTIMVVVGVENPGDSLRLVARVDSLMIIPR